MDDILQHLPRLRRYARALAGDRASADDLVQDTVERALTRSRLFRRGTNLSAWLLTIMHNIHMSQMRRLAARPALEPVDEASFEPAASMSGDEAFRLQELEQALASLPVEQREVLLLIGLEDLSYEETAKILDIPVGTVMSRLSRARQRLRSLLRSEVPPGARDVSLKLVK